MSNYLLFLIFLLLNNFVFGQNLEDYKVYSSIIRNEFPDSNKSVAIIKNGIDTVEKNKNLFLISDELSSHDKSLNYQVFMSTENYKKEKPTVIDSLNVEFFKDYCNSSISSFVVSDNFDKTFQVFFLNKFPVRQKSIQKDWTKFYKNNPNCSGILSVSNVKYYTIDKTTAISYYWIKRNGLNGHGAIAILTKVGDIWQIKYKTYVWWN